MRPLTTIGMVDRTAAELVAQSTDIDGDGNYLQGCAFSPDGLCVLTSSVADSQLRLYNTPTPQSHSPLAAVSQQQRETAVGEGEESQVKTEAESLHDWKMILSASGGDTVRCYTWYPHMKSSDLASSCFLATARDQPVHLYDAYTGSVRATYRPFNGLDEMESPTVVEFTSDGQKLLCAGFRTDRTIQIFETAIPGREPSTVLRLGKTRRSSDGQKGLVSAAGFLASRNVFAVGTYAPGSIYVYDFRAGQQPTGSILSGLCVVGHGRGHSRKKRRFVCLRSETANDVSDDDDAKEEDAGWFTNAKMKWFQSRAQGGVTQLRFDPSNECILYSASRRSNAIIAWDLRMLSGNPEHQSNPVRGLASYATNSDTNQRLEFDIDATGQDLYVGGRDNCVRVYDLSTGKLKATVGGLDDAANGVSHTYQNGRSLLAVATGSRRFQTVADWDHDGCCAPCSAAEPPGYLRLYEMAER